MFDALIEFMKKQALRNDDEIVRYYAKKYRKVASNAANKGYFQFQHQIVLELTYCMFRSARCRTLRGWSEANRSDRQAAFKQA